MNRLATLILLAASSAHGEANPAPTTLICTPDDLVAGLPSMTNMSVHIDYAERLVNGQKAFLSRDVIHWEQPMAGGSGVYEINRYSARWTLVKDQQVIAHGLCRRESDQQF